ncbi:ATP-binding protein [Hydrogenophaga sp.]|uniref:sensor histidine kinase n=1 Tax=Hydrogenophaga sp. TaxID=1904254 RepID=UPI0025BB6CD7|nr:ATP-binding protein [Hydrogenophaga sp.]
MVWALAWLAMGVMHPVLDLANLAMMLVLASALAALWLPPAMCLAGCALAVLAFNFAFVPPRFTFSVDLHQHALLLTTMLSVSWIVALLMARQRRLAEAEHLLAQRARQLQDFGATLRDTDDPRSLASELQAALASLVGSPVAMLLRDRPDADTRLGEASSDGWQGLGMSLRHSQAMGPGTGRHEEQAAWYLPMRGRQAGLGAALLPLQAQPEPTPQLRAHAQALCDQMGLALERADTTQAATAAREQARAHALRNTLLAAISHDYRTPLATILGAASSLHDQADRLSNEQRQRLAATIIDEAVQLGRITDNTLQLARLDTPGLALHLDWESAEEIVGTVLRRTRQRQPDRSVKARVQPGLPLLRVDAVLLVQMLDNLVDNALKYGGNNAPVEMAVTLETGQIRLAVLDRGPGIAPEWRERVFDAFQRGDTGSTNAQPADAPARRGAGVGLAVCRTIARAHGGELTLRMRQRGGCSFECTLPVTAAQADAPEAVP